MIQQYTKQTPAQVYKRTGKKVEGTSLSLAGRLKVKCKGWAQERSAALQNIEEDLYSATRVMLKMKQNKSWGNKV